MRKILICIILLCSCRREITYRGIIIDKTKGIGGVIADVPIYFLVYNLNGQIIHDQVSEKFYYNTSIGDSIIIIY